MTLEDAPPVLGESLGEPPPLIDAGKIRQGRSGVRVRLWRISVLQGTLVRELCHETEYAPLPHSF